MWQTETLQGTLDGIDGHGIRPVLRASPALTSNAPIDITRVERRRQPPRHADSEAGRGPLKDSASAAACAALDCLGLAIILLDPNRRVLLSNSAAMRVKTRGDCFHINARQLQLIDRQSQCHLEAFLRDRATTSSELHGPLCVASRDRGSSCYFLFAEWLDVPSTYGAIASVQIHEPRQAGQLDPNLLGTIYGLTRMEATLVVALYSAPILHIAADQCGIALNTAKTHLKHVFAKCGVHSKAELLRMLALGSRTL
jgi:Bacterial regulatory proteins, luxR family